MTQVNRTISITGASGFIGKRLVLELLREDGYEIRVLSRDKQRDLREKRFGQGVEIFEGDLSDLGSLKEFLVSGCTVINLVYLWNAGEELNLACTHNLLAVCKDAKVARLIHCSTAAVAGRSPNDLINEKTQCLPITEYGTTKLRIEQGIINSAKNHFDVATLRPTSVFGIDGEPLKKLAADISSGNRWKNYLKSCLFGERRMNLVSVANVVGAIIFLMRHEEDFGGEVFIVSDDDSPINNFADVEKFLMREFRIDEYVMPKMPLPLGLLAFLLGVMGRNNINPRCNYVSNKLRDFGFERVVTFEAALAEYAAWYRSSQLG